MTNIKKWLLTIIIIIIIIIAYKYIKPYVQNLMEDPVPADQLPILDIEVGELYNDTVQRSSYDLPLKQAVPPSTYFISLDPYGDEKDGYYFIKLRNGDKSAQFPWFPTGGIIDVSMGYILGIEFSFHSYPATIPENRDDMSALTGTSYVVPDIEKERQAIVDVYNALQSLQVKPIIPANCLGSNSIYNFRKKCNDILDSEARLQDYSHLAQPWTDDTLLQEFDEYFEKRRHYDEYILPTMKHFKKAWPLLVGAWVTDNGSIIKMEVEIIKGFGEKDIDHRTYQGEKFYTSRINLRVSNTYVADKSFALRSCFHSDDFSVSNYDISYTPKQAAIIYKTMWDTMGEFYLEDGKPITDPYQRSLVALDIDTEGRNISNKDVDFYPLDRGKHPKTPEWCKLVPRLEKELGYTGP